MKKILIVLAINITMLHAMEERPGEGKCEHITTSDRALRLWELLDRKGFPGLKFISVLPIVRQPEAIKNLNIPRDLKKYVLNLRKEFGTKLVNLTPDRTNIKLLISYADLDIQDSNGDTLLIKSVRNGSHKITKHLINGGANVNIQNSSFRSALMVAVSGRDHKTVQLLTNAHADINMQGNRDMQSQDCMGMTALMLAAENGSIDIVKHLLKAGAHVTMKNKYNRTALDIAVSWGNIEIVELLHEAQENYGSCSMSGLK